MAEPDHVFVRPMPNLAADFMPAAYPFFYIEPKKYEREQLKQFYAGLCVLDGSRFPSFWSVANLLDIRFITDAGNAVRNIPKRTG
jgi:hypothetical protein